MGVSIKPKAAVLKDTSEVEGFGVAAPDSFPVEDFPAKEPASVIEAVTIPGVDPVAASATSVEKQVEKKASSNLFPKKSAPPPQSSAKDPKSSLDYILGVVKKEKGDAVAVKASTIPDVIRIPTGIFEFDFSTGGGFPRGRYSIVYGPESSGKTNISLKAIAWMQKYGPLGQNKCVFVDAEHSFDPKWATLLGVDCDELIVIKPAYGEEAVDLVDAVLRAEDLGLLVYDSLAVTVASKEVDKSVETADVGSSALLIKRMVNKIVVALAREERKGHYPGIILLNQRRFKVGVLFGDPETMPGGETMRFLSSLTVRLYGKNVTDNKIHPDLPVWKHTSAVIKKAKIPVCAVDFEYDMAMVQAGDIDIGDSDSWNAVAGHLKKTGKLYKTDKGWHLLGMVMPTLAGYQEQYVCDLEFRVKCQQAVVQSVAGQKFLVKAEGEK